MSDRSPTSAPIACTLRPPEMAERREVWEELAQTALAERRATPAGAQLRFRALPTVGERVSLLADLEADCCSFATWSVSTTADEVVLDVVSEGEGIEAVRRIFELC